MWRPPRTRVRARELPLFTPGAGGYPGTAMSLAPLAYVLYQRVMNHDPSDPSW
ncbi:hypothetical protein GV794_08020, partial [Nocardia cyriacigeorgica]|nr:hypothetical protein [Nocardia cyriacigeorgica]